jgi:hypothetical protein
MVPCPNQDADIGPVCVCIILGHYYKQQCLHTGGGYAVSGCLKLRTSYKVCLFLSQALVVTPVTLATQEAEIRRIKV